MTKMKQYLAIEDGERFYIKAKDLEDAKEQAVTWNAEIIEEIKEGDTRYCIGEK